MLLAQRVAVAAARGHASTAWTRNNDTPVERPLHDRAAGDLRAQIPLAPPDTAQWRPSQSRRSLHKCAAGVVRVDQ
jgi:hypothetical protein